MSHPNLDSLCDFLLALPHRPLSPEVLDAAKQSLVDWFAVCIAALNDSGARLVRQQMRAWKTQGRALSLYGDRGVPAAMAMINATLAHALDYDDVHLETAYHPSSPTLAVAFALAMEHSLSEHDIIVALLAGYEVGTTTGGNGIGVKLAHRGWHPTGVLGPLSATAAAAVLLKLDRDQIANAFGIAATQMAGLTASGGTMAKPFHVGKAAMNGLMAAELAAQGLTAAQDTLDDDTTGVFAVLFQERVVPDLSSLGDCWQILQNGFKAYAACQLTHAPFEAARQLNGRVNEHAIRSIRVLVNPLAPKMAKYTQPQTATEGKFSISYGVALGLRGHNAVPSDFSDARISDRALRHINDLVEVVPVETVERWAAKIELQCNDGTVITATTEAALGSPSRPLGWPELEAKFMAATESIYGGRRIGLFKALRHFEEPGRLAEIMTTIERPRLD